MSWSILVLVWVAVLLISYFMAKWFYEAAEAKGYHDRKYFHIAFWFGIWGCLLVVALPDRGNNNVFSVQVTELPR